MTDAHGTDLNLGRVAFVGDSLTEGGDWAAWLPASDVVNLGIGGATSDDVLERLPAVIAEHPDTVVLLIGTNDLAWHRTTEHIVQNIETILATLRRDLPDLRILVHSIFPRQKEYADRIADVNRHLWQFAPTVHAAYLDTWPVLAQADGELDPRFSDDRLHLGDEGYRVWLEALVPALDALLRMPPRTRPITLPFDEFSRPEPA